MKMHLVLVEQNWRNVEAITVALSSHYQITVRNTITDCLLSVKRDRPAAILLNELPNFEECVEAIQNIKRHHPEIKIVTLALIDNPKDTQRLLYYGVDGMLHKEMSEKSLRDDIGRIISGQPVLHSIFVNHLVMLLRKPQHSLTKREHAVLLELSLGKTYQQICDSLNFTRGSLTVHIQNLYRKLGVSRKSDAIIRAQHLIYISHHHHTLMESTISN